MKMTTMDAEHTRDVQLYGGVRGAARPREAQERRQGGVPEDEVIDEVVREDLGREERGGVFGLGRRGRVRDDESELDGVVGTGGGGGRDSG